MNPNPDPLPTSSDPIPSTVPGPAAAGPGIVEFVRTQRQNAAYVLLALSLAFLGTTIWLAVKGFKSQPTTVEAKPDKPDDPFNPDSDPSKTETINPNRGPYLVGAIGTLVGFLVTAGVGVWYLVGLPNPSPERQRTEARISILAVGVVVGLVAMLVGLILFYFWSESLIGWLDKGERKEMKWVLYPLLLVLAGAGMVFLSVQPARAEERNNTLLRRMVYGSNLGLNVLLLFVVLVVANIAIAMRVPNMLDTTSSGFYSLSPPTTEFLENLNPDQQITAYAILQGSGRRTESDVRDLMAAFEDTSRGQFKVRFISAAVNTAELAELRNKYPQVELNDAGVLLTTGEDGKRHSFIPFSEFTEHEGGGMGGAGQDKFVGESRLMKELVFLGENKTKPIIYFTQSAGELDIGVDIGANRQVSAMRSAQRLKAFLEKNYLDVRPLKFELGKPAKVPDDCAILVLADPELQLTAEVAEAIKKYMTEPLPENRKGKLIVLAGCSPDAKKVSPTGLEDLLKTFNVNLSNKFMLSISADRRVPASVTLAGFTREAVEAKNPVARTLRQYSLELILPREVSTLGGPAGGGNPAFTALTILQTKAEGGAWLEDEIPTNMNEAMARARQTGQLRHRTVGVVVSEGGGMPGMPGGSATGRIAVYGNGLMVSDAYASQFQSESPVTFDLIGVTIDWLRDRPPVPTGVVSKTYTTYIFPNPKTVDTTRLLYFPLGLGLLLVAGLGAGVWVIRRK